MSTTLKTINGESLEKLVFGAVSIERTDRGLIPWRVDWRLRDFYVDPLPGLVLAGAGVRVQFRTTARTVRLRFSQVNVVGADLEGRWDLLIDGTLVAHQVVPLGEGLTLDVPGLSGVEAEVELDLPTGVHVRLEALEADGEVWAPPTRPRWVTHGSSITHCLGSDGPSNTWPALAARAKGWDHVNMGFSGQCKIDQVVARVIARTPADRISLCLGINTASGLYGLRSWIPAVDGFLMAVRDGHPETPLLVISPILSPPREEFDAEPCTIGLKTMRRLLEDRVARFRAAGDRNIFYLDGQRIIGPGDEATMPDELHPDADGMKLMARRFVEAVPTEWAGD